jgi:hypothetical protein
MSISPSHYRQPFLRLAFFATLALATTPAPLHAGLPGTPLNLYRQTETGLSEVPCLHDPEAHTLTTLDPVDFSIWSVGPATVTLPPTLEVARAAGQRVTLAWPTAATGYVREDRGFNRTRLARHGWARQPETLTSERRIYIVAP